MSEEQCVVESLARKWRPRKFKDMAGQEASVLQMRGMIKQNRLPGFLLLVGPSGCGKTTLARLFARYINCEKKTACGECPSCLHDPDNHPDVNEGNAASERGIDEIRRLVQQARFKPRYKIRVVILDEAHQLTPQATEAFLKPLEDNPKTTLYIVCTSEPEKLKPAMLTRARTLTVKKPTAAAIKERLLAVAKAEKIVLEEDLLEGLTEYSGGAMRTALNLLESVSSIRAGDPKADAKSVLVQVGASASPGDQKVAQKLVLAMHLQASKAITRAVFDIEDPVPAINLALRYNEYVMGTTCMPEGHPNLWHTADCKAFASLFKQKVEKLEMAKAITAQKKLMEVRNLLVMCSTSSRSLLLGSLL